MTRALYNENDPFAAKWLERLIADGLIAPGRVDARSIVDIEPADVAGPGQRHFFAGIGGWSYALRLAGISDDADVWTGSCPCQPFSDAGARGGTRDPRHLWPTWFALIRECRPPVVFGEQVASRAGLDWLDIVSTDLEGCGYAVGAADLCAAGVGAPHIRQRLYFVAYAHGYRRIEGVRVQPAQRRSESAVPEADRCGTADELGNATGGSGRQRLYGEPQGAQDLGRSSSRPRGQHDASPSARDGVMGDAAEFELARSTGRGEVAPAEVEGPSWFDSDRRAEHAGANDDSGGALGDACRDGNLQHDGELRRDEAQCEIGTAHGDYPSIPPGATRGFWYPADWLPCSDGVSRPVEPGTFPLAHGVPARVGRLRGHGNAIVPQLAAVFIRCAEEARRALK